MCCLPVQISHSTTPKENMSLAVVHSLPSSCSGDAHNTEAPVNQTSGLSWIPPATVDI